MEIFWPTFTSNALPASSMVSAWVTPSTFGAGRLRDSKVQGLVAPPEVKVAPGPSSTSFTVSFFQVGPVVASGSMASVMAAPPSMRARLEPSLP